MTALAPLNRVRRLGSASLRLAEALTTPHPVDRYLELVSPRLTVRDLRATVVEVRRTTPDTVTLVLRPTRQWRGFRAGQFVQLAVDIDGVRRTRCYSPVDSQHRDDGLLELTVKATADGLVSRWLHREARPGLVVGLSQADGTFCLPDERPQRVLLVSGGSGITPVLSMLRTLVDEGHANEIVFLHYTTTRQFVAHRDELAQLAARHPGLRLVLVETDEPDGTAVDPADAEAGDDALRGFFGPEHLDAVAPWSADAHTFVCGPPGLMHAVRELYVERGIADRLHSEEFAPAVAAGSSDPADVSGTVSFARSGTEADNSGATLLEQAEAAGLTPDYGCRMGICFTCTSVKTAGCTRNLRTGELDSDPDSEIQLCISVPVGDVTLDL